MQMWIKKRGFEVSWLRIFYFSDWLQKFDTHTHKIKASITDINNY